MKYKRQFIKPIAQGYFIKKVLFENFANIHRKFWNLTFNKITDWRYTNLL